MKQYTLYLCISVTSAAGTNVPGYRSQRKNKEAFDKNRNPFVGFGMSVGFGIKKRLTLREEVMVLALRRDSC